MLDTVPRSVDTGMVEQEKHTSCLLEARVTVTSVYECVDPIYINPSKQLIERPRGSSYFH